MERAKVACPHCESTRVVSADRIVNGTILRCAGCEAAYVVTEAELENADRALRGALKTYNIWNGCGWTSFEAATEQEAWAKAFELDRARREHEAVR